MKIIHRNTTLRTINENDIEQIRLWRNAEQVNRYLKFRNVIDKQSQLDWFNSLDSSSSIYFLMEESSKPYGVIYVHNINLQDKSFEGSIFTGDSNYMNTPLPVKSVMMLFVLFFDHLSFDHLFSTVHSENSAALELNKRFGFKVLRNEGEFTFSRCTKNDFELRAGSLKKSLLQSSSMQIILEKEDEKYPFLQNIVIQ